MSRIFGTFVLLSAACLPALAQAPSAPASPPAGATSTIDQEKRGNAAQPVTQRSTGTRPGGAPPPMNIKIQGEGIKLPACTAESREGEACKK